MIKLSIVVPVYNQDNLIIRALDSIPKRNDIEILIIDDNSIDDSVNVINNWIDNNKKLFNSITFKINEENMGCGFSKNWAYSNAKGEYIITLDSDDYLYTENYNRLVDNLYNVDTDIITIDNDINNGSIWGEKNINNPFIFRCATWSYFCKKSFLTSHNLNYDRNARRAGDLKLSKEILKYNPSIKIWNVLAYHYNYPREGSIVWNHEHGKNKG